ncbi:hypothetical protein QYE76_028423 [Lolium multiflorum]|uniref:cinnamyl-alcohol dehydrogenase n=1 Tax=Lolium multiflorum TaxID=4521 RepID=A0AAD8QLW9_LOLMU|nr:hypothetical protein QYE76_028423 [Lolium multiflorum]
MEKEGLPALGWAARDTSGHLSPCSFSRRVQEDDDVTIKVLFCGICHTDLHIAKLTSNGVGRDGENTRGGFSDVLVVNQDYVLRVPESLALDGAAPLLCAGVTVYGPMMRHGLNAPGKHLGVVGLGGLGHLAVKFGKAFGMTVTVISSSPRKRQEALERLGADAFLLSNDPEQMKAAAGTMDGIIDTVSAGHPIVPLLDLLSPMGQIVLVGGPSEPLELPAYAIMPSGKGIVGNCVGGIRDCQAMLDFAGKHGITADVEVVKMDYVNTQITATIN